MNKALTILLILIGLSATAQQDFKVRVEFYSPTIVHVTKARSDYKSQSLVVINSNTPAPHVTQKGNTYKSTQLRVVVNGDHITFYDKYNSLLMQEGDYSVKPITHGPDTGSFMVKQAFRLDADEEIYGVGMLQNGKLSQRGENRRMIQNNLEDYAHFYQSIKGYGIFWDNYSPTQFITPESNVAGDLSFESEVGDAIDYYFIYGKGNADGVIEGMRHLTGNVPMFPLWTYGFHQSRERYKSQEELLEVVHKYRHLGIPFDGIIQDWQYWGSNYNWNAMEFISDNFLNAQSMIDEVHHQNAHMSISIWASFGPETKAFKELKEKGHLFSFTTWPQSGLSQWPPRLDYPSGVRCYDVYSKEARDIYWKNLSRLHKMGIDAWWMDSTDPDHIDYKDTDLDEMTEMGSWRRVRNAFSLMTVGGVYDNQRAVDNTKRVFTLTRSFFAGQQRYGAMSWSGDVGSSWDSFRKQIPLCLNHTLTGNPNVNTDLGGFFANAYNKHYLDNSGTQNPQYQELYTRWMQFGTFCPMMRSHGTEVFRELYYYGKEGEPIYDALTDAVRLRYRLMPYIYSNAFLVSQSNGSYMRALFMDFKYDTKTWNNNREYMFGHSILVCPVLDPLYTEEKIVKTDEMSGWDKHDGDGNEWPTIDWTENRLYEVYLPSGTKWYDYYTNELLEGGQTIKANAPISHCPLYVRAGSILPVGPDVQYAAEKKWDDLEIVVYPGKMRYMFVLYEDEGDNYNYEKGHYSIIPFMWDEQSHTLTICPRQGSYEGMLATRTFRVHIVGQPEKKVTYNGKKLKIKL